MTHHMFRVKLWSPLYYNPEVFFCITMFHVKILIWGPGSRKHLHLLSVASGNSGTKATTSWSQGSNPADGARTDNQLIKCMECFGLT